jgi:hypothetical protein
MIYFRTILLITLLLFNCQLSKAYEENSSSTTERQFVVSAILTDENLNIQRLDKKVSLKDGDLMVIYSHDSDKVLGYARVLSVNEDSDLAVIRVETHDKNGLIRTENYLKKIDLLDVNENIPGRFDLTFNREGKAAAKFRPLVYSGLSNGMTANNLVKGEFLLGPSILAYGLSSNYQLDTNLISTMFKVLNLGLKTKLYDYDDVTFSIENSFQYYHKNEKGSYLFSAYLDTTSNSHFKSYAKLKMFTHKPEDQYLYNSDEYRNDLNVELQLSYGYLFKDWSQIIFGPKVDVNKKRVGGSIGYYVVDKNFHTMVGVSSNDFSEFSLGKEGYLFNLDFWWRF